MTDLAPESVLWLVPLAPLVACLWTVLVTRPLQPARAHVPCVAGLVVALLGALYALGWLVPAGFAAPREGKVAVGSAGHGTKGAAHGEGEKSGADDGTHGLHEDVALSVPGYRWLRIGGLDLKVELRADALTASMLAMITSVGLLVAVFAAGYMHDDPGTGRFFAAVALFVFSMCMLVLSANFFLLFVFWEAVGLCSYLLIGFWFGRPSAAAAAKKAFVVNRIGDLGFLLGVFLVWRTFGTLDFAAVLDDGARLERIAAADPDRLTLICLLLFVGAVGKSAQFPLHVWLPDAMEGPTPVSALIHAATMVTAGVYLVARCTPLFLHAPDAQLVVAATGAATALIAALAAVAQDDLKRVLAYSTVSQLGFMFMSLGAGAADPHLVPLGVTFAMFHMVTHAWFKALLFLGAGSVMHAMGNVIDMRRFGGLRRALPITHWTFLVGSAALAGFPLLAGFWSKDEILSVLKSAALHDGPRATWFAIVLAVALFTSLLTAFYTFRAYFLVFHGPERFPEEAGHHPHEAPPVMAVPLRILAVFAAGIGLVLGPTHLYSRYLSHVPGLPHAAAHGPDWLMMGVSSVLALAGVGGAWFCYVAKPELAASLRRGSGRLHGLLQDGLGLDALWKGIVVGPLRVLARFCEAFDRIVVDGLVDAVGQLPALFASVLRPLQDGLVPSYAWIMLAGLTALVLAAL